MVYEYGIKLLSFKLSLLVDGEVGLPVDFALRENDDAIGTRAPGDCRGVLLDDCTMENVLVFSRLFAAVSAQYPKVCAGITGPVDLGVFLDWALVSRGRRMWCRIVEVVSRMVDIPVVKLHKGMSLVELDRMIDGSVEGPLAYRILSAITHQDIGEDWDYGLLKNLGDVESYLEYLDRVPADRLRSPGFALWCEPDDPRQSATLPES